MKTQLELKHLAPYLPYGLKIHRQTNYKYQIGTKEEWDTVEMDSGFIGEVIENANPHWTAKPILRPLSDLLNHDLDLWIELGEVLDTMNPDHFTNALIDKTTYALSPEKWIEVSELLDKLHIDWRFDLIDKGLAIDINTINQ